MKKEGASTHQSHAPLVGAHQKLGEGVGVRLPQRSGHPPLEGVEGKRIRGHPRALPVSLRGHLPNTTRRFTYSDLRLVAKTAFSDLRLVDP